MYTYIIGVLCYCTHFYIFDAYVPESRKISSHYREFNLGLFGWWPTDFISAGTCVALGQHCTACTYMHKWSLLCH